MRKNNAKPVSSAKEIRQVGGILLSSLCAFVWVLFVSFCLCFIFVSHLSLFVLFFPLCSFFPLRVCLCVCVSVAFLSPEHAHTRTHIFYSPFPLHFAPPPFFINNFLCTPAKAAAAINQSIRKTHRVCTHTHTDTHTSL